MAESKPTDFRAQWDELRRTREALEDDKSTSGLTADDLRVLDYEAELGANDTLISEAAEAAWATRAHDLADILLLAEIAYDRFFDLRSFPSLPAGIEISNNWQERAVACLVRGIVDVARAQPGPTEQGFSNTLGGNNP